MTAEIAILNRSAIALAADSAVTISVRGRNKVYDTAEKLFEFSRSQPIALMIYNNVEFVGVPLDVLIRKYRSAHDDVEYETMRAAADKFVEYLRTFEHDVFEEEKHLYQMLLGRFRPIFRRTNAEMRRLFRSFIKTVQEGRAEAPSSPDEVLANYLDQEAEAERARPLKGFLTKVTLASFKSRFAKVVEEAFDEIFAGIEKTPLALEAAAKFAFRVMKSDRASDVLTGLVFGGFGKKDMFPTVRYLEIDGVFFDQIKVLSSREVDIDRQKKRAEVVPFAQKEMVERFMFGLDSELEQDIKKFVNNGFDEILAATTKEGGEVIKSSVKAKVNSRFAAMMDDLKETARQDLLDIVYFMSKKELADIAYALVELTSQKRRFSTDEQTVGGPIDVAIITKSEGLVWIRRKHYFGPETNQAYYSRVFGRPTGGSNDGKKADE